MYTSDLLVSCWIEGAPKIGHSRPPAGYWTDFGAELKKIRIKS